MNTSATVATWLSFGATAVGLGGLISQANAINERLDPFHANRNVEYLGVWFKRQKQFPWWVIAKALPVAPIIKASLSEGFCDIQILHLTRVPLTQSGKAGWSALLAIVHMSAPIPRHSSTQDAAEKGSLPATNGAKADAPGPQPASYVVADPTEWYTLPEGPLIRHQTHACILISRTTLITMLLITNARKVFQYSDAAGFRGGYASYSGQWYITWPIGQEAIARFAPHDSHSAATDVYPPSFPRRVDRCVQMLAGVVSAPDAALQVAFCGRKPPGAYMLKHIPKGFPGAHGSRHLYNMMGGKVYEVDFMFAAPVSADDIPANSLVLHLPSAEKGGVAQMIVSKGEEEVIKTALDCLPWTALSWSLHRGMRDILLAYAKPVMNAHRQALADMLKRTVAEKPEVLDRRGWNPTFVRHSMGDMAASAVLAGQGNSGDLVRVVTDIVLATVGSWNHARLDNVRFWRRTAGMMTLDVEGVVALTKLFVLEWSAEFDYQLYHELPISLYFS